MTDPEENPTSSLRQVDDPVVFSPHDSASAPPVEIDAESTETDSTYGDDIASYTASIGSSAFDYPVEHGRRYHAYRQGRYLLPNDEIESDRLDIHHEMILTAMHRKLHLAPIPKDIQRVIDLGTGTGIWALEFADQYPSAEVKGNDLSPIQPKFVAPNLQFYIDDMEDDWGLENHPFDYIHARFLTGSILDWPKCTKPGGWVEFQDLDTRIYSLDGSLSQNQDIYKFHQLTSDAQERRGYNMSPGPRLEQWLLDAGFINVCSQKYLLPLGTWPKENHYKRIGAYNYLQLQQGLEGIALASLTRDGEWSPEEVQILVAQAKASMKDSKIHGIHDFYAVYGQKPGPGSGS